MRIIFIDLKKYQDTESILNLFRSIVDTDSKIVNIGDTPKDSPLSSCIIDCIKYKPNSRPISYYIIDWLARCESMILGITPYKLSIAKESPKFWYKNLRYVVVGSNEYKNDAIDGHFIDISNDKITRRYAKEINDILMHGKGYND